MLPEIYRITNITMLLWGSFFSLIAALYLFMGRNYQKERRTWMFRMQLSTAALLISDAGAWFFRGDTQEISYYMVRICNFLVFALTNLLLLLFQQYMGCYLLGKEKSRSDIRLNAASMIAFGGIFLAVVSQFTGLYDYVYSENFYQRNPAYVLAVLLPLACMLIDISLMAQYRKNVSPIILVSMSLYIVIYIAAALIQIVHYGGSLINLAVGCSMIFMYIAATGEENKELNRLAKNKEEIAEKLQIASILNRCVKELSSNTDEDQAINHLLAIINEYFDADRSYIFEINFEKNIIVNTYEHVKNMVTVQKENLQEVPLDVVSVWMESFRRSNLYFIPDVEQERGTDTYELLKQQDIHRLLAVPLKKDEEIIGFLGVDNPESHYEDATLLASIQFFITSSLERKKEKAHLKYLSYRDKLTELYNRNRYIELLDRLNGKTVCRTGVAYIDLNGLKKVNDRHGHEAGDELIKNTASVIGTVFEGKAYRVGGDEFVIISMETDEQEFDDGIKQLRSRLSDSGISVSTGAVWSEKTEDLESELKKADALMYQEKEEYHRKYNKEEK